LIPALRVIEQLQGCCVGRGGGRFEYDEEAALRSRGQRRATAVQLGVLRGFVPPIPMNPNIAVVVPVLATVRMDATLCVP